MELLHKDVTEKIIKAFFNVYHTLGYGFHPKVYENAMMRELSEMNLRCESQRPVSVFYKGEQVGSFNADLIVEDAVILELKVQDAITEMHEFQLINYLKATEMEVGLLLNFGRKPVFKRKVVSKQPLAENVYA